MITERTLRFLPLNALRSFEVAARLGSFKSAASELRVTPAAVSHQVKALEERLGILLFERLHRALLLTRAGEELAEATSNAFDGVERALGRLAQRGLLAGSGKLRVDAAASIAAKWLAPRLHGFHAFHPGIDVHLEANNRVIDIAREPSVDIALRYGAGPYDPSLEATPLWKSSRVVAVCSPVLIREGRLRRPDDIFQYDLVRTAQPSLSGPGSTGRGPLSWEAWMEAAGIAPRPSRGPHMGSTLLALEVAMAGRGLALSPYILVHDDLNAGRLAMPFAISLADPFSYWLLCRRERTDEARIRAFTQWIVREAGTDAEPDIFRAA